MTASMLRIELESDEVIVGQVVRGRVEGAVVVDVVLRAQELRGTSFHRQDEARAPVASDGSFELAGPLQPSFFGEAFSIEWMVVARTPTMEAEHPLHVIAPLTTRRVSEGKRLATTEEEGWIFLVASAVLTPYAYFMGLARTGSSVGGLVFGLVVLFGTLSPAVGAFRRFRVFHKVRFTLGAAGVDYEIAFRARREVELQRVFVRLSCIERAPSRGRAILPARFQRIPVPSERMLMVDIDALDSARRVYIGDEIRLTGTLEFPDDAPFSLQRYPAPTLTWHAELWTKHDGKELLLASRVVRVDAPKLLAHEGGRRGAIEE